MEFARQEYLEWIASAPSRSLPDPRIQPTSVSLPWQAVSYASATTSPLLGVSANHKVGSDLISSFLQLDPEPLP